MKGVNIIFFCVILLLTACERYEIVDLKVPFKSKLVVFSVVEANTSQTTLMLSRTRPVIGGKDTNQQPDYVANATVYLTHNNVQHTLVYDTVTKRYSVDLGTNGFKSHERYSITVITPEEKVTGNTVIPDVPTIQCSLTFKASVVDSIRYYRFFFKYTLSSPASNILLIPTLVYADSSEMPLVIRSAQNPIQTVKQGETIEQEYFAFSEIPLTGAGVSVKLKVAACDEAYTKYYNKYAINDYGLGTPFSQPKITFSNLSNGIGIFGSFAISDDLLFEIK